MVNSNDIRNAYIDLYSNLRRYIWDYYTVKAIAILEVSCYDRFPILDEVQKNLNVVRLCCQDELSDDEELKESFDNFYELIQGESEVFSKLAEVSEVLV